MTNRDNTTCSICGKPYYLCVSCKSEINSAPWKIHTDTSEHYKVYQIIHGLSVGVYDKKETRQKLSNVDLSDKDSFKPEIKKIIDDVLATKTNVPTIKIIDDNRKNVSTDKVEPNSVELPKNNEQVKINDYKNIKKK